MTHPPHYIRFARSLALLGGLGAAAGCGATTNSPDDAFTPPMPDAFAAANDAFVSPSDDAFVVPSDDAFVSPSDDAFVVTADAGVSDDAFDRCAACTCFGPGGGGGGGDDAGLPDCNTIAGSESCCFAIGPLSPPDLVV